MNCMIAGAAFKRRKPLEPQAGPCAPLPDMILIETIAAWPDAAARLELWIMLDA
jgi:hypothetical protein